MTRLGRTKDELEFIILDLSPGFFEEKNDYNLTIPRRDHNFNYFAFLQSGIQFTHYLHRMPLPKNIIKNSLQWVNDLELRQELSDPTEKQIKLLRQFIHKSKHTAFGEQYNFEELAKENKIVQRFQSEIPLCNYDEISEKWWHRCLDGEKDVCWQGKIKYFALSSGTTGASSKYIPVSDAMLRSMRQTALHMFCCLPKFELPLHLYLKDWLMIGSSATLKSYDHYFAGDLSGINASKPPLWIRGSYKPGVQIARLPDWESRVNQIAKKAHKWDVSIVAGIASWVQLTLEKVIEYHGLENIHEIWPNFKVFVSGGVALQPYRKSFETLIDKPVIYMDTYLASEGFFAFQKRPGTNAMSLLLQNGIFYEFIPFDDEHFDESGQVRSGISPLTISDVKEGVDYALVITSCSGAWRYLIGDMIRFSDLKKREILVTGRTKHFLNICGEHVSVDNLNQVIIKAESLLNIPIPEYTVGIKKSGTHFRHHWYIACENPFPEQEWASIIDRELKAVNDDYAFERSAMMGLPLISIVSKQIFYEWHRLQGKLNGQSKIPRVMKGEQWKEWEKFARVNIG